MDFFFDIARAVLPLVIVGGIGIFVVFRLKHKYNKGTLGKKNSKDAQKLLNSLIPFGMLIGSAIAVLFSTFSTVSFLNAMTLGPAIGMLFGYFAYEFYSKKEDNHS